MSLSIFGSFLWQPITNWHFARSPLHPPAAATVPKDAAAQARRRGQQEGQLGGHMRGALLPDWLLQAGEKRLAYE